MIGDTGTCLYRPPSPGNTAPDAGLSFTHHFHTHTHTHFLLSSSKSYRLNLCIRTTLTNVSTFCRVERHFKRAVARGNAKTQGRVLQDPVINLPIEALPRFGISNICFNSKQPDFTVSLRRRRRLTLIKQAGQRPSVSHYEAATTGPQRRVRVGSNAGNLDLERDTPTTLPPQGCRTLRRAWPPRCCTHASGVNLRRKIATLNTGWF